jgi:hypothetical protein
MPIDVSENVKKWFAEEKVSIQLFPETGVRKFRSLSSFYDFIQVEMEFWEPIDPQIHLKFNQVANSIRNAIQFQENPAQFQQQINGALAVLRTGAGNVRQNNYVLFSGTALAGELKRAHEKYGDDGYKAFLHATISPKLYVGQLNGWDKNQFFGLFDAYVHQHLNDDLKGKVEIEEKAHSDARSRFAQFVDEANASEKDRKSAFETFSDEYRTWKTSCEDEFESQKGAFNSEHTDQLAEFCNQFNNNEVEWKKRIEQLEELYREKLRLSEPVKYWKTLEAEHKSIGKKFAIATSVAVLVMVLVLTVGLYFWPPEWMKGKSLTLDTLKGSFILLTITSLAVYVVHFLAKFSVSSYHLARDAEERKQLTYVYLSLLEKGAVSKEQQEIVLSALFSRADTGLLKGDSHPSMPVANIANLAGKSG